MTVSYSRSVATVHRAALARLLLRWRGSVYKAVWPIFVTFCLMYGILALTYYFLPSNTPESREIKRRFVQICAYAGHISNAIPVSFVLGFFVNIVVGRWWQQFLNLPTPDSVCFLISTYLKTPEKNEKQLPIRKDENRTAMFRHAIARYLNLAFAICFLNISLSMKRQVGSIDELVELGLMTREEEQIYLDLAQGNCYFFIPLVWAITLITRAHHEGMVGHDRYLDSMVGSVVQYWKQLQTQFLYDYVNIPLVYNQVVTLVVYLYLATMLLSHQFTDPSGILKAYEKEALLNTYYNGSFNHSFFVNATTTQTDGNRSCALDVSPNVPVFALLSLLFYSGWLRVAETNVFPFGEDDDDFESVPLLERNMSASIWLVTSLKEAVIGAPEVVKSLEELPATGDSFEKEVPDKDGRQPRPSKTARPSITELDPNPVSDLPCPEDLRRRSSKYFFAGSMARICEEEASEPSANRRATQVHDFRPSQAGLTDPDHNILQVPRHTVGSPVGNFFGRVGERLSEVVFPRRHSTTLPESVSSGQRTDVSSTSPVSSLITQSPRTKTRTD